MNTHFEINNSFFHHEYDYVEAIPKQYLKEKVYFLQSYGDKILSMKIGKEVTDDNIKDAFEEGLQKVVNVENVTLDLEDIDSDKLLSIILNKRSIKILQILNLCLVDEETISLFQNLDQLSILDVEFDYVGIGELKLFCNQLKLKPLQQLQISLKGVKKEPITEFCQNFTVVGESLRELSLQFENIQISVQSFVQLQAQICKMSNHLESLKLSFMDTHIDLKYLNQFFIAISKAQFNLKLFHLTLCQEIDEKTLKSIRSFVVSQKALENLQISGLQIKQKLLEQLVQILSCNKNVIKITGDIFGSKLQNTAMSSVASSLAQLKNLQEIKLLFDTSSYKGSSILDLGEALRGFRDLKDLRIEFPGTVKQECVTPFAESITKCVKLNYLYIFFQAQGEDNIVEFSSETLDSTIFENKKVRIYNKSIDPFNFKKGELNHLLFSLIISNQFKQIEHLEYNDYYNYILNNQTNQLVDQQIQELINKCDQLVSLVYNSYNYYTLISIVQSSQSTLKRITILKGNPLRDILECKMDNLELLKYEESYVSTIERLLLAFPKLTVTSLRVNNLNYKQCSALIQSNVIVEQDLLAENQYHLGNEKLLAIECLICRRSAINILTVNRKYLKNFLKYQQEISHLDLWLDI